MIYATIDVELRDHERILACADPAAALGEETT